MHWDGDKKRTIKAPLIASWNADEKCHTGLITSFPQEEFTLDAVNQAYRLRWQIVLLFKEWNPTSISISLIRVILGWRRADAAIHCCFHTKTVLTNKIQDHFNTAISTRKISMC